LRDHTDALNAASARVAAVGLGDRDHAHRFREASGIPFPLLVDEKREAYRATRMASATLLHLLRPTTWRDGKRARQAGHRQGRSGQHIMQLGGSFVFGPGDTDLYAHQSSTFGDHAHPSVLMAAVEAASA